MEKNCFPNKCFYYREIKLLNSVFPWCDYTNTHCKAAFEKCENFIDKDEHWLKEMAIQSENIENIIKMGVEKMRETGKCFWGNRCTRSDTYGEGECKFCQYFIFKKEKENENETR